MSFDYTVRPLPALWPAKQTPNYARKRPQFKTIWSRALELLAREISMLRGSRVEIAIDVEERHLGKHGQLRADARPRSSSVIVSFDTKDGRLQFPCDTYTFWQENVDAIARALEALRLVNRYGVQQGKQYAGFKAIPATTAPTLGAEQAATNLVSVTGWTSPVAPHVRRILEEQTFARDVARIAMSRMHPDKGGSAELFAAVQECMRVLAAHHGVPSL